MLCHWVENGIPLRQGSQLSWMMMQMDLPHWPSLFIFNTRPSQSRPGDASSEKDSDIKATVHVDGIGEQLWHGRAMDRRLLCDSLVVISDSQDSVGEKAMKEWRGVARDSVSTSSNDLSQDPRSCREWLACMVENDDLPTRRDQDCWLSEWSCPETVSLEWRGMARSLLLSVAWGKLGVC